MSHMKQAVNKDAEQVGKLGRKRYEKELARLQGEWCDSRSGLWARGSRFASCSKVVIPPGREG